MKRKGRNVCQRRSKVTNILFESSRDHSFISSFGIFLWEESKTAAGGHLSRLCGAPFWRRWHAADSFPHGGTAARPFAIRTSGSVPFLHLWGGSFRAGVKVNPFTSRRLLNGTAICCLTWFLSLSFCLLSILGARLALAATMTRWWWTGMRGVAGAPGAPGALRSPRRRAVRVAGAAAATGALLRCAWTPPPGAVWVVVLIMVAIMPASTSTTTTTPTPLPVGLVAIATTSSPVLVMAALVIASISSTVVVGPPVASVVASETTSVVLIVPGGIVSVGRSVRTRAGARPRTVERQQTRRGKTVVVGCL